MEELLSKFEKLIADGDRMFSSGDYSGAYESYLNALYALAAIVVYRGGTGMLVPPERLPGFLGGFPELEDAIRRYSGGSAPSEEAVRSLREELERLRGGMMSLPSSER
ncbi:hypothetical protein [Thermococcus peptonophilus]|uniref:hypothetical protein n=1 Tax=Thermococcus peptonophilus TaxID=53952 RepID=UPI0006D09BDE